MRSCQPSLVEFTVTEHLSRRATCPTSRSLGREPAEPQTGMQSFVATPTVRSTIDHLARVNESPHALNLLIQPGRRAPLPRKVDEVRTLPLVMHAAQPDLIGSGGGSPKTPRKEMVRFEALIGEGALVTPHVNGLATASYPAAHETHETEPRHAGWVIKPLRVAQEESRGKGIQRRELLPRSVRRSL
jgi:hypothetical protein